MAGTIGDGERQRRLAMKNGGDGERKTLAVPTTRDEYPPNNTTSLTLQQLSTTAKDGDESKIVGDGRSGWFYGSERKQQRRACFQYSEEDPQSRAARGRVWQLLML
ncbi:hypothetical protein F0562_019043 [Nyssa sinensis]|uniref:Uncharacterized protein n=1 Tax=Nyssa sinensis TaxID=561372 RepID=A0A5J4ZDJ9_9ASTE|nr:hypothetical protein F0562_019043 [Nyssa sinensis]